MHPSYSNINKERMIEALEKTLGVVTKAAKMVGIDRSTHYDWYKNDPGEGGQHDHIAH